MNILLKENEPHSWEAGVTDKIEITPEMILAGEEALCSCDDAFSVKSSLEWIVVSVFSAMWCAHEKEPH